MMIDRVQQNRPARRICEDLLMTMQLCPVQQKAFDHLQHLLPLGHVFTLTGNIGLGRTTVLGELHREIGGAFLSMKEYVAALRHVHPSALEETFEDLILAALEG